MIAARIERFITAGSGAFDELALELFRHQYRSLAFFRALCDERGRTPDRVRHWKEAPLAAWGRSGDRAREPSSPILLADTMAATLALADLEPSPDTRLLSLASSTEVGTTSLALLAGKLTEMVRPENRGDGSEKRRLKGAQVRSWLAARQRDQRPTLVSTTPERLLQLVDYLEKRRLRFRLPPATRVVELSRDTSGSAFEASRPGEAELATLLGLAPEARVRYVSWPSLASPFRLESHAAHGLIAVPPPWARIRVVDPTSLEELPAGQPGDLAVVDLATQALPAQQLLGLRARIVATGFAPVGEG
jgi:hypothetical protein